MSLLESSTARALCAAAILAVAGGCTHNPSTGRSQLLLLSTNDEIALGEESKPALIAEYGGEVGSQNLRSYVALVGDSLSDHVEEQYRALPWEFIVVDSDVINAFALPGGKIFVSRGLLVRLDNEAELAGVLGHEIGHVTAQHVNERISHALIVQGIAVGASVAVGQSDSGWAAAVPIVVGAAGNGYLLSFSRKQESEADVQGVKYMTAAGYDPRGMLELLGVLRDASEGPRPPEFLSTHPYPETRIETVSALLAGPYLYTQDNAAFQLYRDRYQREATPYLGAVALLPGTAPETAWCGVCRALALDSVPPVVGEPREQVPY